MKHLLYLSILCSLSCSVLRRATIKSPIYLDQNGVTVISTEDAVIGESYELDGVSYLVVDSTMLYTMVANDEDVTKVITTNVTDMSKMFYDSQFNGDISNWDVSNVTDMSMMIYYAPTFNQNIGSWDVSKVTDMFGMFLYAETFNQNIGYWEVSNVTNMSDMFYSASSFNQDIGSWDVDNITDCESFSDRVTAWTLPHPNFTNCTE